MHKIWVIVEIDVFQGAIEVGRNIAVYDSEAKAQMLAQVRQLNNPEYEYRIQGWPMNDSIE